MILILKEITPSQYVIAKQPERVGNVLIAKSVASLIILESESKVYQFQEDDGYIAVSERRDYKEIEDATEADILELIREFNENRDEEEMYRKIRSIIGNREWVDTSDGEQGFVHLGNIVSVSNREGRYLVVDVNESPLFPYKDRIIKGDDMSEWSVSLVEIDEDNKVINGYIYQVSLKWINIIDDEVLEITNIADRRSGKLTLVNGKFLDDSGESDINRIEQLIYENPFLNNARREGKKERDMFIKRLKEARGAQVEVPF